MRAITKNDFYAFKEAVLDFDKIIESNSKNAAAYFGRGFAKTNIPDPHGAIYDYDQAIELKPDYNEAYFYRGNAHFKLLDKTNACADWKRAEELGNTDAKTMKSKYCH